MPPTDESLSNDIEGLNIIFVHFYNNIIRCHSLICEFYNTIIFHVTITLPYIVVVSEDNINIIITIITILCFCVYSTNWFFSLFCIFIFIFKCVLGIKMYIFTVMVIIITLFSLWWFTQAIKHTYSLFLLIVILFNHWFLKCLNILSKEQRPVSTR